MPSHRAWHREGTLSRYYYGIIISRPCAIWALHSPLTGHVLCIPVRVSVSRTLTWLLSCSLLPLPGLLSVLPPGHPGPLSLLEDRQRVFH